MKKLKVMSVVGTRPEIIRLSRVLAKLDEYCDHLIVHTGQNYDYELNEVFFKDLGVRKPDYFLNAAGKNAAETIGQVIIKVDEVLEQEKPEAMLVLGDTNSCISAIPAKRRKIPIFLGQNYLFTWLRDNGILIATGERRNVPKQEYISRGYFTLKETVIDTSNGSRISFTTRITGKGQQWLMKRLLDAGVLVPVAATR